MSIILLRVYASKKGSQRPRSNQSKIRLRIDEVVDMRQIYETIQADKLASQARNIDVYLGVDMSSLHFLDLCVP